VVVYSHTTGETEKHCGMAPCDYQCFNQLTTEFISGSAHLGNGIDLVFLSNNGGRLQNIAMA